jgi:hypothetical protein
LERLEKELKQRFGDLAPDNAADEIVEESGGNAVADKLVSDNEELSGVSRAETLHARHDSLDPKTSSTMSCNSSIDVYALIRQTCTPKGVGTDVAVRISGN